MSTDNVQFEKKANPAVAAVKAVSKWPAIRNLLISSGVGAVGNAGVWDFSAQRDREGFIPFYTTAVDLLNGNMDSTRKNNLIFNAMLGGASGAAIGRGVRTRNPMLITPGIAGFLATPYKDITTEAQGLPTKIKETLDTSGKTLAELAQQVTESQKQQAATSDAINSRANYILAALGTGALGLGGLAVAKYLSDKKEKQQASIKYRVQGKKGDPFSDAIVDMPIRVPRLSPKTKEGLEAGLRRQVNKQVKYLSLKRDPNTGKMISYDDWNRLYGQDDLDASTKNPDENYVAPMDEHYEKSAATREWAEGAGSMLQWLLGSAAGAYLGDKLMGDGGVLPGKFVGAAVGGLGPGVVGSIFGSLAGKYSSKEQAEHDSKHSIAEFVVPGYADYQSSRRNPLVNIPADSIEDTGSYEDDDDFDKEAGAPAGTPPSGQSAPQHKNTDMKTVPATGNTSPVAPGDAAKKLPPNPGAVAAMNSINKIRGMYGIQPAQRPNAGMA